MTKDKEDKILSELSDIKAQLEVLKAEYPSIRTDLNRITQKISSLSERLTGVEKDTLAAHSKIEDFKKSVLWTISVSVTACGVIVGILSLMIQYLLK